MKDRRARKQKLVAEINITPFTDVILVLLVIFMIATPLISQSSIKVKLPEAASGKPIEGTQRTQVDISITSEGIVYLEDKLITKKQLKEQVSSLHAQNPDINVILRSDRMTRFSDIVSVLDVLTALGVTKLNIAATQK